MQRVTLPRPEGARHCLVDAPGPRGDGRRPLVILLHGAGASARQVMGLGFPPSPLSAWRDIAARERLVVIAADARRGWNDCFASDAAVARQDDVAFVAAIIDHAIAEHDVDADRVFVVGVSRGGLLAYRVAVEIPRRLAGFSAVLAGMAPPGRAAEPEVPLPALIVGATADPLMPYEGGKRWYTLGFMEPVRGIEDSVRAWCGLAGLTGAPRVTVLPCRQPSDRTRTTHLLWGDDPAGLQVALFRIEGGGHAEPSPSRRYPAWINALAGPQGAALETAEAQWAFFEPKQRA